MFSGNDFLLLSLQSSSALFQYIFAYQRTAQKLPLASIISLSVTGLDVCNAKVLLVERRFMAAFDETT
jgi:hypothetical protein